MEIQYKSFGLVCALDRQWAFAFIDLSIISVFGMRLGPLCVFLALERGGGEQTLPIQ